LGVTYYGAVVFLGLCAFFLIGQSLAGNAKTAPSGAAANICPDCIIHQIEKTTFLSKERQRQDGRRATAGRFRGGRH
jgi:hypothetical protein